MTDNGKALRVWNRVDRDGEERRNRWVLRDSLDLLLLIRRDDLELALNLRLMIDCHRHSPDREMALATRSLDE